MVPLPNIDAQLHDLAGRLYGVLSAGVQSSFPGSTGPGSPYLHCGDVGVRHGQLIGGIAGGGPLTSRCIEDARHRRRRGRHVAPLRQHMQPQQPLPGGMQIRQQLLLPVCTPDSMCCKT